MEGLAIVTGVDIGQLSRPPGSWWVEGAVLDADFANGRFR
jgi:hypothetical protein